MKIKTFLFGIYTLLISMHSVFAKDNMVNWQTRIDEGEQAIALIDEEMKSIQQNYRQVQTELDSAELDKISKQNTLEKARDAYNRGSSNVDIIAPEDLVDLLKSYQAADSDYRLADDIAVQLESRHESIENEIERLNRNRDEANIEILEAKATMFNAEMLKPIWAEGHGESILDENKSINECKRLALEYAKRDAMEKGGKSIIESVTQVEEFMLVKDAIKTTATVEIIEQDYDDSYGEALRVDQGDVIKFVAKVRLKLRSVDVYNPYSARVSELRNSADEVSSHPSSSSEHESRVLFVDDFSKNEIVGWKNINDKVQIYNGALLASHGSWLVNGDPEWDNYMVLVDVNALSKSGNNVNGGIIFRTCGRGNYRFEILPHRNEVILGKWDGKWHDIVKTNRRIEYNNWYRLSVSAIGNNIKCYIDNEIIFNVINNDFPHGYIVLQAYEGNILYDNVRVEKR